MPKVERIPKLTRKERLDYLINKGYTVNPKTGHVYHHNRSIVTNTDRKGYIVVTTDVRIEGKFITINAYGHHLMWYVVYSEIPDEVDHDNSIHDNNRPDNLLSGTHQENQFNIRAKGYSFHKLTGRYTAQIHIGGKKKHLGMFDDTESAHAAYLEAKKIYHPRPQKPPRNEQSRAIRYTTETT